MGGLRYAAGMVAVKAVGRVAMPRMAGSDAENHETTIYDISGRIVRSVIINHRFGLPVDRLWNRGDIKGFPVGTGCYLITAPQGPVRVSRVVIPGRYKRDLLP